MAFWSAVVGEGTLPLCSFEVAHLQWRWAAPKDPSVTNSKPLPCMFWLFNLVDHGHGIVLGRNVALPVRIRQQLVLS